ncbi:class I SAM-dependent RNA methyltransferase [Candidatus Peregrinibacteria bacterium]|nr:class I SAM-dependent RNA methyltransferase [Candidatus Peregrinibacteria bacterium]
MELIATCAFGLEKLVYDEIKKLGLWVIKKDDGRVFFEGDETALIKANLWLRCADRILVKIGKFMAVTFDELFDAVNALEWEKYIGVTDCFPVKAVSVKSALHSEPAVQSIVKKAVVKRLQQKYKTEILPENSNSVYQIIVKSHKDEFTVCIDSSGESLHKRGYRKKGDIAPIKETLAAAMVKLSDWTPDKTLVDPFCGSGTIAIEAALIANNIAPGINRKFAFDNWKRIDKKIVTDAIDEAKESEKPLEKLPVYCFDIDPIALKIAQHNAANAGFDNIHFKRSDFNDLDFGKFENCTFITNPPYGERLEDAAKVNQIYKDFGKKFTQTKNCSLFLITSNEDFPRLFGRPADKNRKLFNGNIKCYLYSYYKIQSN